MKSQIHPETYPVIYHDITTGSEFFSTSTVKGTQTKEVDGVTYFVIPVEISASSHPFYTGEQKFVDSASRIQKFQKKQDTASQYKVTVKKKVEEKKKSQEAPRTLREMLMGI